jgi:uncharacterized coiled-coil protein SlyX
MALPEDVVLMHEYDPVKAREYYLRTRELKGRAPAQGESASQDQVKARKSGDIKAAAAARDAQIAKLQEKAAAARLRIEEKIANMVADLELSIPENASPKLRAFMERQNKLKSKKVKEAASAEREKVVGELRSAVASARDMYSKTQGDLKAKREAASKSKKSTSGPRSAKQERNTSK